MKGPVKLEAPTAAQPFVNKDGSLAPYGHRWTLSAFYRIGGYEDAVWKAQAVGVTGLAKSGQIEQKLDDVEAGLRGAQAAISGLRGDDRLEAGVKALQMAVTALAQALARSSGETDRRLEDVARAVAVTEARLSAAQQATLNYVERVEESSRAGQRAQAALSQQQAVAIQQTVDDAAELSSEVSALTTDDVSEGFNRYFTEGRVRASLSATAPVTFNGTTGAFGLALTSGDVTGALTYTPTSVTGLTGVQSVAAFKTGLSLGNVEDKSSATIRGEITSGNVTTALGYTPTSVTGLTGVQSVANFKTGLSLVKADVGLGNVTNESKATMFASPLFTGAAGINRAPAGGVCFRIQDTPDDVGIDYVRTASDTMALLAFDRNAGAYGKWLLAGTRIAFRYQGGTEFLIVDVDGVKAALPTYADNAAAVSGGLATTSLYKTATGEVRVVV